MRRDISNRKAQAKKSSAANLDTLIEEAIVDAYDESEQAMGFYTTLDEHLEFPFKTEVLGVEVLVSSSTWPTTTRSSWSAREASCVSEYRSSIYRFPNRRQKARNGSMPIADGRVEDSG